MAALTYQQVLAQSDSLAEILAIMASGQWPDGTQWALPTTGSGLPSNVRVADASNLTTLLNADPAGSEYALPVRNIPGTTLQRVRLGDGTNLTTLLNADPAGSEYALPVRHIPGSTLQRVRLGDGTNLLSLINSAPAGSEFAPPVRNIPSGTQQSSMFGTTDGTAQEQRRIMKVFKVMNGQSLTLNTDAGIWTPAAGKRFRLMRITAWASVAAALLLKDGAAGTVIAATGVAAGGAPMVVDFGQGILSGLADRVLNINPSASTVLWGVVMGTEE